MAGRPIKYTDHEINDAICEMAEGNKTLLAICKDRNWSYGQIMWRISECPELTKTYARVRADFAHANVEKLFQIADEEIDVARARLKCDNVKWYAQKVVPKFYGERVTHSGDADAPINIISNIPMNFEE